MWISVEEKLPCYQDFAWVRLEDNSVELAYHRPNSSHPWQVANTAGDGEGIYEEFFYDVTHWQELVEPKGL